MAVNKHRKQNPNRKMDADLSNTVLDSDISKIASNLSLYLICVTLSKR